MGSGLVLALLLTGVVLLTGGNWAPGGNGVPEPDGDYERAITACAMMLFGDALKQNTLGLDKTGHGAAYDAFEEKCRIALGSLMDH